MLWAVIATMTVVAAAVVLWPLFVQRSPRAETASEVTFYRAQLDEIDRDVSRGLLPVGEAMAARAEASRRLISAAGDSAGSPTESNNGRRVLAAAFALIVLLAIGIGVYAHFGRPELPDAPLASRQVAPALPDQLEVALQHIEAQVAAAPDNLKAWSALAPAYLRLGRYPDAVKAYRNLLRLRGEDGPLRANLGEAEVAAAGGKVTKEAKANLEQALADAPGLPLARYYLALGTEQAGDKLAAIAAYRALLGVTGDHPDWQEIMRARLVALGAEAPASTAAPPVDAGNPNQDMIRGMVQRLATRLAANGGSAEEWSRLIRAYTVLSETDKAQDALTSARKALGADATATADLDALSRELGLAQH
jgi:cytochrome c-type biogenesis protein CcmH